jgi:hypothetical protein
LISIGYRTPPHEETKMTRTASLGIRVEPAVKTALESAAKADRRTVASYIEKLIVDDLGAKGYLPKDAA